MTAFTRGLHEIGDGLFAWLQPDGGWGWSNAGLIVEGRPGDGAAALVDTLFDTQLTAEMLAGMERATGFGAASIGQVVNTHANGDHTICWRKRTSSRRKRRHGRWRRFHRHCWRS